MLRSPRQDHEGVWLYVMNRGINRQVVFRSDDDRQTFYDYLARPCRATVLRCMPDSSAVPELSTRP